jgi:DsbC/DsbD-like thiol-disulfide interchange protein/cytochrome c biogenesis protein CcdA
MGVPIFLDDRRGFLLTDMTMHRSHLRRALAAALLSSFPITHEAAAQFGLPGADPVTRATLLAEVKSIAPGSTFTVALSLDHPEKWHSYYRNSGSIELPPEIKWTLPEGFAAGPIQWPVPEVKEGFFGKSFIYSGNPLLLIDLSAPASIKAGETVTLTADATWQICQETCVNENASFKLTLPVAATSETNPENAKLFGSARARIPTIATGWDIGAAPEGESVVLRLKPPGAVDGEPTDFIPDQPFVKSVSNGGTIRRDGEVWEIRLPRVSELPNGNQIPPGDSLSGILLGAKPLAIPLTKIGVAVSPPPAPRESLPFARYLPILGGMLLGGLILNLMPCVFPVIGLKIMGFVQQAGADRRKIVVHGIVFTLGVLASFAVISGILFALRSTGGEARGWGYQLQEPWVVLSLMLLMFVLALNMFGVFEIGASATSVGGSLQAKQGLAGSFFSGVLATVVATPCSAPFLGAAIGAAIALPALQFFTAFGAMAMGLALPYLVLSVFPKLIDYLPRPGAWMESFKQAMSFLLFATAGYLLWVYAGLIELDNLLGPVFGLSAIAVACWIHGRWNLPHRSGRTRAIAMSFTALFAAAGLYLAKPPKPSTLEWQPWSMEKQTQLLEDGTPVYIDFTAKWCATCQVNKQRAYTDEVIALMHRKGVAALKADKTKPNPEIEKALSGYGRTAIPVNVLLVPGKEPVILPELLSPGHVIDSLKTITD